MPLTVYLAGPINDCTDEECRGWRNQVKDALTKNWFDYRDPMIRDYRGKEQMVWREIVELDKRAVRDSDVLLVRYTKPSVGTSMEIIYAWQLNKLVLIWCDKDANLSPWLLYHNTAIVYSFDEVVQKIKEWNVR